jgi:hypothetical protein
VRLLLTDESSSGAYPARVALAVGLGALAALLIGGFVGGLLFAPEKPWSESAVIVAAVAGVVVAAVSLVVGVAAGCPHDQPDCDKAYPLGAAIIGAIAFAFVVPWATVGRAVRRASSKKRNVRAD